MRPETSEPTKSYMATNTFDDNTDDLGIFFILATEAKIHDCLGLPSVALLQSPL